MLSILHLAVVALSLVVLYPVYVYFLDQHHLRRFPTAHPLAGLTDLWIFSRSLTRKRYLYVAAAHEKLGPVVRLAPTHISFPDPGAFRAIHSFSSNLAKDDFYSHVAGGNPSMAQTTGREDHSRKRRWMSNVFSAKEITAMEPRVRERVGVLLASLSIKAEGGMVAATDEYGFGKGMRRCEDGRVSFDIRPWMNMMSYDAITAMFWSNTYGCLERGSDLVSAQTACGMTYQVHAMASYHGTTSYLVPLAQLSGTLDATAKRFLRYARSSRRVEDFGAMVRYLVTHRIASPPSQPDLFSSIAVEPTPKRPEPMPYSEIMAECTTMLDAGNDTTQTSLMNALYLLSLHPEKQARLRAILNEQLSDEEKPVASYQTLQHIPYLRAVLDESFRVRPPVNFGLPRKTISATLIAGHELPAGVTVSSPLWSLHRDPSLFSEPEAFLPERWLPDTKFHPEERANLKDFVLPFSIGGRACIGRNLAYMELSIVIAALVLAFHWELDEAMHGQGKGLEVVERLNANPKHLWVRARAIEHAQ